jgi:hypothetical protein
MIVFFTSYNMMAMFLETWTQGCPAIFESLNSSKPCFVEEANKPSDSLLSSYGQAAVKTPGALLFAVMGGKLSEGINFGDELGRAVFIVGLPFPNNLSLEWKEGLAFHLERSGAATGPRRERLEADLMETACMKSVNQTIGRVIRHAADAAVIVLLEDRWRERPSLRHRLPAWMTPSVVSPAGPTPFPDGLELIQKVPDIVTKCFSSLSLTAWVVFSKSSGTRQNVMILEENSCFVDNIRFHGMLSHFSLYLFSTLWSWWIQHIHNHIHSRRLAQD